MSNQTLRRGGGCLCGAVRYEVCGPLRDVVNCHCTMCRRAGFLSNIGLARADFVIERGESLRSYASSDSVRRYFCSTCGSPIYWDPLRRDFVVIAAGTLDQPTGLKTVAHIYVGDKPDYYEISDGLPIHLGPMYEQES